MVEVKYNNAVIASLEAGQTATLQCIGKKMLGNVVVTAPEAVDNPLPIEITTEAEMNALLETAEVGSIYKYTGTTGAYENGALYVIEEEAVNLISFTVSGTPYQAEEGMTWEQWVNSTYNTGGLFTSGDRVYTHDGGSIGTSSTYARPSDVIQANTNYALRSGGAG